MNLKSITTIYNTNDAQVHGNLVKDTNIDTSIPIEVNYTETITKSPRIALMQLESNIETLSQLQKKLQFLRSEVQEIIVYKK